MFIHTVVLYLGEIFNTKKIHSSTSNQNRATTQFQCSYLLSATYHDITFDMLARNLLISNRTYKPLIDSQLIKNYENSRENVEKLTKKKKKRMIDLLQIKSNISTGYIQCLKGILLMTKIKESKRIHES